MHRGNIRNPVPRAALNHAEPGHTGSPVPRHAASARHGRLLALHLLIWTAYGVVRYSASLPAIASDERGAMALAAAVRAATGLVVSGAAGVMLRRWVRPERGRPWLPALAAAVPAAVVWMAADRAVLVTLAAVLQVPVPWHRFPRGVDVEYGVAMLAWTAGAVGLLSWEYGRRMHEALLRQQVDARDARHHALLAQLNPHFLFNALNTVGALAAEDPARTREVVVRLSAFLRRVLSLEPGTPAVVDEEMELVGDYLAVEQARFEAGLQVSVDATPDARTALVPPLILQPLVENAIKHGAADADGVRRVWVRARMDGDRLAMVVENTGVMMMGTAPGAGLGLRLTRTRLEQMYGRRQSMELAERAGRVVATIGIHRPERRSGPRATSAGGDA